METLQFNQQVVQSNGTLKNLGDMGGGSSYSTEEQVVGTWIDGKALYRKVISTTVPECATQGTVVRNYVSISELHATNVTNIIGIMTTTQDKVRIIGNYFSNDARTGIFKLSATSSNKIIYDYLDVASSATLYNNAELIVIIEYTKD